MPTSHTQNTSLRLLFSDPLACPCFYKASSLPEPILCSICLEGSGLSLILNLCHVLCM